MRRFLIALAVLAVAGLAVFWLLTAPRMLSASDMPSHTPDVANGEQVFLAGGCASCHAAPKDGKCDNGRYQDEHVLAGGRCLITPFGTFNVPNISSDKAHGIGAWTTLDFANAMVRGVSPGGSHYYPAFPYTSYQRMTLTDVIDLKGYLDTLPASANVAPPHDLALPFRLRRGLGLWKLLFLDGKPFTPDPGASAEANRGKYLVDGAGHCGECHTERNIAGGFVTAKWLAGGPAPEGDGWVPNLTPAPDGLADWSKGDLVYLFQTGSLPDGYDALIQPYRRARLS